MLPSMNHTGREPNAPRDVSLTCFWPFVRVGNDKSDSMPPLQKEVQAQHEKNYTN